MGAGGRSRKLRGHIFNQNYKGESQVWAIKNEYWQWGEAVNYQSLTDDDLLPPVRLYYHPKQYHGETSVDICDMCLLCGTFPSNNFLLPDPTGSWTCHNAEHIYFNFQCPHSLLQSQHS